MRQRPEYLMWMCCFLAGGMAGAGVGLLLAPQSGRDTRGRMGRRLRRAARSAGVAGNGSGRPDAGVVEPLSLQHDPSSS